MMDHHSIIKILTSILAASSVDGGVPLPNVMQLSSLSYKHAKEYMTILTDRKLIEYDKRTDSYTTNKRGLKFLNSINKVTHILKRTEKEFDSSRLTATSLVASFGGKDLEWRNGIQPLMTSY
jgi:predicted transcriptional regulator